MSAYVSQLEKLLVALCDYGKAKEDFAGLTIIHRKEVDIEAKVSKAVAELGVMMEWFIQDAKIETAQAQGVSFNPLILTCEIGEAVTLNQTGKGAWWLAERALAHFNYTDKRNIPTLQAPFVVRPGSSIKDITERENPNAIVLQIEFQTRYAINLPTL